MVRKFFRLILHGGLGGKDPGLSNVLKLQLLIFGSGLGTLHALLVDAPACNS